VLARGVTGSFPWRKRPARGV